MINILDIGNKIGRAKEQAETRYGGFQARLVASTIDIGISIFVLLPIMNLSTQVIFSGMDVTTIRQQYNQSDAHLQLLIDSGFLKLWLIDQFVNLLIFMVAVLACWLRWGATPGKLVFGMRIVDSKTLERPAPWQLVVRAIIYPVSLLVFGLGFVWITFQKRKRGWHDLVAGTVVISKLKPLTIKDLLGKNKAPSEEGARSEEDQPNDSTSQPKS